MASALASSFTGAKVQAKVQVRAAAPQKMVVSASMQSRRNMLSFAAAGAALLVTKPAMAGLTEDLLAASEANKELNDKKRAATSGANFARSRTVTDGTCGFPSNFIGCENLAEAGNVKFLTDDLELECQGVDSKACPAKAPNSFPSFLGV